MKRRPTKPSRAAIKRHMLTLDSPGAEQRRMQRYADAKAAWLADNPSADSAEVEAACRRLARMNGL